MKDCWLQHRQTRSCRNGCSLNGLAYTYHAVVVSICYPETIPRVSVSPASTCNDEDKRAAWPCSIWEQRAAKR